MPQCFDLAAGAFRTAMAARSYKQELIIMLTTVDRMLPTLQVSQANVFDRSPSQP